LGSHTGSGRNVTNIKRWTALAFWICRMKVNYIVDCDIRGFFDSLSHEWLVRFIEHRIGDPRIIRLIRKWLKAGVLVENQLVQGADSARPDACPPGAPRPQTSAHFSATHSPKRGAREHAELLSKASYTIA
jgi:RNA-directed DNA polymerase